MARASASDILIDGAGNGIANAVGLLYTDEALTTPVSDAYNAASGGSLVTTVTTDSSAGWQVWFTTPKSFWIQWTDNGNTAYPIGAPTRVLDWSPFKSKKKQALQDPGDEGTEDSTLANLVLAGTLAARPAAGTSGRLYWASNVRRLYRDDGADWWPSDTGNGVINGADYGLTGVNTLDVTTNLQSLMTDARADNLAVFIPPVPAGGYHKVTGTVDVDLGTAGGMVIHGLGGTRQSLPGQMGGSTEIVNTANNLPIFAVDSDTFSTSNFTLQGLALNGFGLYFRAANSGGGGLQIGDCAFYANGADQCVTLIDSFWHRIRRTAFTSKDTSSPSVLMQGSSPTANEDISYLFSWQELVFFNGGIRYEQNVNYLPNQNPGQWVMASIDTEGFVKGGPGLVDLVRGAGVTDAVTLQGIHAVGVRHFDTVAGSGNVVPFGRSNAGTGFQDVTLDSCLFLTAAIVNNSGTRPAGLRLLNPAGDYIPCVDAAGSRSLALAVKEKNGGREYFGSSAAPAYGAAARQDTDVASRWGVLPTGKQEWGDGTSAVDTNLYRSAADTLKTDDAFVAVGNITAPSFIGASRMLVGAFTKVDFAGTGADVALALNNSTTTTAVYTAIRAGSITGLSARVSEARAGGTVTVTVQKNGVNTALVATIDGTNTTTHQATSALGTITYAAGDTLGVVYHTAGPFSPVGTNDLSAWVQVNE